MDSLLSVSDSAFIFLLGLILPLPESKPDMDEKAAHRVPRRRALFALLRLLALAVGLLGLLRGIFTGIGSPTHTEALLLLTALYSFLILLVQRSERNRRVATALFMGFCAAVVSRYAAFRDYDSEGKWAVYIALLLNYGFWWAVGRHYPPADSSEIEVWGMEE